jgi:HEAT repeat protein
LLHLDTKNTINRQLFVRDNMAFFIFMDAKGRETSRTPQIKSLPLLMREMERILREKPTGLKNAALLKSQLLSPSPEIRGSARSFISMIKKDDAGLVNVLVSMINDPKESASVVKSSANAIARLATKERASKILKSVINSTQWGKVRGECLEEYAKLDAKGALPLIAKYFDDRSEELRLSCLQAVAHLGPEASTILKRTSAVLFSKEPLWHKTKAAISIGKLGKNGVSALPDLQRFMRASRLPSSMMKTLLFSVKRSITQLEAAINKT